MTNNAATILIKSRILDIVNENVFTHRSSVKWFEQLKGILTEFFEVETADYFIYDSDTFIPLKWNHSLSKKLGAIKWIEIESFFYEKDFAEISLLLRRDEGEVVILLRNLNNQPLGLLVMDSTEKWKEFAKTPEVDEFIGIVSKLVTTIKNSIDVAQQELQYRNLFNVTKMFNSTLDIDQILESTLFSVNDAFPNFESTLILSNDQDRKTYALYKLFDYTSERQPTVEAYVSGEITTELALDLDVRLLNIPIKGNQGIYGILQISAPLDYLFSVRQKEYASLLATATGNALENAKLYIQSHRLVSDLQLINETSHKLNMNISLNNMVAFLKNQLIKAFNPEQTAFVFIEEDKYNISEASTEYFHTIDGQLYIQHVANKFRQLKDSLFIADFNRLTEQKYEYRSLIAIPFKEQNTIVGFSIVLHKEPYFFSFDSFKLMQSLIQHSALAISNLTLRNKLQEMVNRDHLTNLFARKYLDKFVENSIKKDERGVFVLMDIDNFKRINDTYGHQIGDEILKQIAAIMKQKAEENGIGARWGGEELALYFPQITIQQGTELCLELLDLIPKYTNPSVTVSIGVSCWERKDNLDYHRLFHHADTALYESKNSGKNQLSIYEASPL